MNATNIFSAYSFHLNFSDFDSKLHSPKTKFSLVFHIFSLYKVCSKLWNLQFFSSYFFFGIVQQFSNVDFLLCFLFSFCILSFQKCYSTFWDSDNSFHTWTEKEKQRESVCSKSCLNATLKPLKNSYDKCRVKWLPWHFLRQIPGDIAFY